MIYDVRRGHGLERRDTLYARLWDLDEGFCTIEATLDYIVDAVLERGYELVPGKPPEVG
jgi:hypothetical protein